MMRRRNFLTGVFAAAVTPNFARAKACIEKKAEFKEAANVDICVFGGGVVRAFSRLCVLHGWVRRLR